MTMGSRIVVMKDGIIQQIDTPSNLFHHPTNLFVAGFLGTPPMNFLPVSFLSQEGITHLEFEDGQSLSIENKDLPPLSKNLFDGKAHSLILGIRGEHLLLRKQGLKATVSLVEVLGSSAQVFFRLKNCPKEFVLVLNEETNLKIGDEIEIYPETKKLHFFDKESGNSMEERK